MIADRIGKGLRGVLSDAMVADVTAIEIRGRAFGLRQSLDTINAFAGPLIAIGLMALFANNMRLVFWVAIIPALLAVVLVLEGSKMHPPLKVLSTQGLPLALAQLVLVAMNLIYAVGAYPLAIPFARVTSRTGLVWGLLSLICADLALAFRPGVAGAFVGIILWGLHMASTQGMFAKRVADRAPNELRG